jgi:hypothetical protein
MSAGDAPAFPVLPPVDAFGDEAPGFPTPEVGLTKREYIATLAMAGLVSCVGTVKWSAKEAAESAVKHADALLAELAKAPK